MRVGRRTLGILLFILSVTCLLQLTGHTATVSNLLHALNIAPNAGGAVGYLVMTRGLARLLSPFGSGVLMLCLALFSVFFTIGFRTWLKSSTAPSSRSSSRSLKRAAPTSASTGL